MAGDQSGEKTEEPTDQRLREASRKGEVLNSKDFTSAFVMLGFWCAMAWGIAHVSGGILTYARQGFTEAPKGGPVMKSLLPALTTIVGSVLLPIAVIFVIAFAISVFQTRGNFSFQRLQLDVARATPKLSRVISKNSLVEIVKGILKLVVLAYLAIGFLSDTRYLARAGGGDSITSLFSNLFVFLGKAGWKFVGCLVIMGGLDFLFEWKRYRDNLKMTREEVKQEHKSSEGDPHNKAERQRVHREVMQERAINDVKKAKFVVVNPDHIAVAIAYNEDEHAAPLVIAKGENLMAEKIKEIARENGIPIFRDVTLARSLNGVVEGDEIPSVLYEAVAELLNVLAGLDAPKVPPPPGPDNPMLQDTTNWTRG